MFATPLSLLAAAEPAPALDSIGTPTLWALTIGGVIALLVADCLITRRPHEVSMKEALGWSAFYIAIPVAFGVWIWQAHGGDRGLSRQIVDGHRPRFARIAVVRHRVSPTHLDNEY